jgi:hypothetical protein
MMCRTPKKDLWKQYLIAATASLERSGHQVLSKLPCRGELVKYRPVFGADVTPRSVIAWRRSADVGLCPIREAGVLSILKL